MSKLITALIAVVMALFVIGCETQPTKQQTGTVVGGVLGGVLGSTIGGGRGQTATTIGGALLGGLLGGGIGKSMDATDEIHASQTLESNRTNQASAWVNPDTGNEFSLTPTRTYESSSGETCREYDTVVDIDGRKQRAHGTACRQPDGSWQIVS